MTAVPKAESIWVTETSRPNTHPGSSITRRLLYGTPALAILSILAGCGDEDRVRQCLRDQEQYSGGQHGTYMTEVVSVQVLRSYPDGRATRAVKYRIQGSDTIQSTTCLW